MRPHCGKGFGLTDPNNPQNPPFNAAGFYIHLNTSLVMKSKSMIDVVINYS